MQRFSEPRYGGQYNYHGNRGRTGGLYDVAGPSHSSQPMSGSDAQVCQDDAQALTAPTPTPTAAFSSYGMMGRANGMVNTNRHTFPAYSGNNNNNNNGFHPQQQQQQQNGFHPYVLDRGNGQFTRMIAADTLPPLNEIPAREAYSATNVVLPSISPGEPRVTVRGQNNGRRRGMSNDHNGQLVQNRINQIVKSGPEPKPEKIYCDKWVHEGKCAFTQQGCRYKHVMPLDKKTQESLGLNGLPAWWLKRQAEAGLSCGDSGHVTPTDGSPTKRGGAFGSRRSSMMGGLKSPGKRPFLNSDMQASSRCGPDGGRGVFADPDGMRRGADDSVGEGDTWSADTTAGQELVLHEKAGHGQNPWGPIEPPKSARNDSEVKTRRYTYGQGGVGI